MADSEDIPSISSGAVGSRFVSQAELDKAKETRDEQWKAAYARLGQEPPPRPQEDAEYDGRSLYEKLQTQKTAKQEEWEEKNKFSNQFRSLEEDEVLFLDQVMEEKAKLERSREDQDGEQVKQFKEAVAARTQSLASPPLPTSSAPPPVVPPPPRPKPAGKKDQKSLLKGIVRKKGTPAAPKPKEAAPATDTKKRSADTVETDAGKRQRTS